MVRYTSMGTTLSITEADLSKLPLGLVELRLQVAGCFNAFQRAFLDDPSRFSNLNTLLLAVDKPPASSIPFEWPKSLRDLRIVTQPIPLHLASLPPLLEFLIARFGSLVMDDGDTFPSTLRELELYGVLAHQPAHFAARWPGEIDALLCRQGP